MFKLVDESTILIYYYFVAVEKRLRNLAARTRQCDKINSLIFDFPKSCQINIEFTKTIFFHTTWNFCWLLSLQFISKSFEFWICTELEVLSCWIFNFWFDFSCTVVCNNRFEFHSQKDWNLRLRWEKISKPRILNFKFEVWL